MKAIKLQRGNKLHHYWLSQYIKGIVSENFILFSPVLFHPPCWIIVQSDSCFSICHLELLSNQMTAFHLPIRGDLPPSLSPPSPWHRTLTSTLLIVFLGQTRLQQDSSFEMCILKLFDLMNLDHIQICVYVLCQCYNIWGINETQNSYIVTHLCLF